MKYNNCVYRAVQEYYSWNCNQNLSIKDIDRMDRKDVLKAFLEWEGIYGYTYYILDILGLSE